METLNTLNFISKAKRIDVHPKMNFQTKSEGAREKQITSLLEKIQFLENEKKVLVSENENLKVKLKMEKQKESSQMKEKESTIQNLKQKISVLEEKQISVDGDLDKTVVVKNKRFPERKHKTANEVEFSYNHLQPKVPRQRKRGPDSESGIYSSGKKGKLNFLKTFNKSIDFGRKTKEIKIRHQIFQKIMSTQAKDGNRKTRQVETETEIVVFRAEKRVQN